jgi:molybdenum cofactor biosynthesis enzyme
MRVADQHSTLVSLSESLVPKQHLLDGRSETDMLNFLCEYATLINFYDNNNNIRGHWAPFLLKDPVFLLAHISKTNYTAYHTLYVDACFKAQQALSSQENISHSINALFDQLTDIFMQIKRWVYYMQRGTEAYELKKYVIAQVKDNFSKYFWAIISLRQNLYLSSAIRHIAPVDTSKFYFFDENDEKIWKENKGKTPYWKVLNLPAQIKKSDASTNLQSAVFYALKKPGDELFRFFHNIIKHAAPALEAMKLVRSKHPDTLLLRTFVHLLKTHQQQLNGIAEKHLHFYYQDILQQSRQPAVPDKVFLTATLAKTNAAYQLPTGTLFDGGVDAQKNPVSFVAPNNVWLNPATVSGAYTLAAVKGVDGLSSLYLQNVANPTSIQKGEDGSVKTWQTFGGSTASPDNLVTLGISFASPLLLLREGQRSISLLLYFENQPDLRLLQNARYFLSTQTLWQEVTGVVGVPTPVVPSEVINEVNVQINLDATQPSIEPFLKDPDGVNSVWPMLKIEFSSFPDPSSPPVLTKIDMQVNVSGVKNLLLYNDQGALTVKTPFPPFGVLAPVSSNFIIGSNEIFSKPLNWLIVGLDWDTLPADFADYYKQYNDYLNQGVTMYREGDVVTTAQGRNTKANVFRRFGYWFQNIFSRKAIAIPRELGPFNNVCFTANFGLLTANTWTSFSMENLGTSVITRDFSAPQNDPLNYQPVPGKKDLLFTISGAQQTLEDSSYFGYPGGDAVQFDAGIQQTALKFSDASTSGFMKISLANPAMGFGTEVYPKVVAYTSLKNAQALSKWFSKPPLLPPPNLPFVPKVKAVSAFYAASQTYDLTQPNSGYPLQCFLYSPFGNYNAYSTPASNATGVSLFKEMKHNGYLFLQMDNVVAGNPVNFYFQLARKAGVVSKSNKADYYYLSDSGWKTLPVLKDGTSDFICSGIITTNIPADITRQSVLMPANKYWVSVAVNGDPSSFAQTVFVTTNGFEVQRTGGSFPAVEDAPELPANTITKALVPVPQVSAWLQPFPSFGGKGAETNMQMTLRVSNRLKTKDRAASAEDHCRLIQQQFSSIYFSRSIFSGQGVEIYVAKACANWMEAGAFQPLVSECEELKIQQYLQARSSAFANISVVSFNLEYVRVTTLVQAKQGVEVHALQSVVNHALNIFLSPWIQSNQQQVTIGEPLTDALVMHFIQSIAGVATVESVSFQTANNSVVDGPYKQTITTANDKTIFVPFTDHAITVIPAL